MPTVVINPVPQQQFFIAGVPAAGALLFSYLGGTTTKTPTYTDSTGSTPAANPIILNANGEAPTGIWLPPQQVTKFVLAPAGDTDPPTNPIWTVDNVVASPTTQGTLATQNANNVNITGGTISVGTLTCTGATTLSTLNVSGNAVFAGIVVNGNTTLSGPLATGTITATGNIQMEAPAGTDSFLISNAPSGQNAVYLMQAGGSNRWDIKKSNTAEGGGNVGSDFAIDSYDNNGNYLSTPLSIVRSTGVVTINSGLTITGGSSSIGSTVNFNAAINIQAGGTVTTNTGLKFTNAITDPAPSTTGAGAAIPAGNPSFWLTISINGGNYAIPCYTA